MGRCKTLRQEAHSLFLFPPPAFQKMESFLFSLNPALYMIDLKEIKELLYCFFHL